MVRLKRIPVKKSKDTDPIKPPHRWMNGTVALREVRQFQSGVHATTNLIPAEPFRRLARELVAEISQHRCTRAALIALQIASENYLVQLFEDIQDLALYVGRPTIFRRDMRFIRWKMETPRGSRRIQDCPVTFKIRPSKKKRRKRRHIDPSKNKKKKKAPKMVIMPPPVDATPVLIVPSVMNEEPNEDEGEVFYDASAECTDTVSEEGTVKESVSEENVQV